MATASRLLRPHRVLGVVSEDVPFSLNTLGDESFVTTSIGNQFQVFKVSNLRVSAVSQPMAHPITAIASRGETTFVACSRTISVFDRMRQVATLGHHPGSVVQLLVLGEHLVSLCEAGCLRVTLVKRPELTARHLVVVEERRARAAAGTVDAMDEDEEEVIEDGQ